MIRRPPDIQARSQRGWPRLIAIGLGSGALVALLLLSLAVQVARTAVLDKLDALGQRTGRTIRVENMDVHIRGGITLLGVQISTREDARHAALSFGKMDVGFDWAAALDGHLKINRIVAEKLRGRVEWANGKSSLDDFIDLARKRSSTPSLPADENPRPTSLPHLELHDAEMQLHGGDDTLRIRIPVAHATPDSAGGAQGLMLFAVTHPGGGCGGEVSANLGVDPHWSVSSEWTFDSPCPVPGGPKAGSVGWRRIRGSSNEGMRIDDAFWEQEDAGRIQLRSLRWTGEKDAPLVSLERWNTLEANNMAWKTPAGEFTVDSVRTRLEPTPQTPPLEWIREVQLSEWTAKAGDFRATVPSVQIKLKGLNPSAPIESVESVQITSPRLEVRVSPDTEDRTAGGYLKALKGVIADDGGPETELVPPALVPDPSATEEVEPAEATEATEATEAAEASGEIPAETRNAEMQTLLNALQKGLTHLVQTIQITGGTLALIDEQLDAQIGALEDVDLLVAPDPTSGALQFTTAAHVQHEGKRIRAFEIAGALDDDRKLTTLAIRSEGTALAAMLPRLTDKLRAASDAEVQFDAEIQREESGKYAAQGSFRVQNVGFQWWRISESPIDGLTFGGDVTATLDPEEKTLEVKMRPLLVKEATFEVDITLERLEQVPIFRAHVQMPRQPCATALAVIPSAVIPRLRGMRTAGYAAFDLRIALDPLDPYGMDLELEMDTETCIVSTMGSRVRVSRLLSDEYVHTPKVEGEDLDVQVGPGTPSWTPFYQIPRHVSMGAVATEDLDFFKHGGFKLSLIRRAIKLDLDRKRYVYGGSTISQQLVKNLFLSREKTLARKIEEALITWQMERTVPKNRILALYLNCIEYGPGIYGIRNASRHYFRKEPFHLTPLEGAFLMGLKPCPKCGYRQWRRGKVNQRWQNRLKKILARLTRRGWLAEGELERAAPYKPHFPGREGADPKPAAPAPVADESPDKESPADPEPGIRPDPTPP